MLGNVKKCDVDEKVNLNVQSKTDIEDEYKRKEGKLKLKLSDFNKIIDLTAPKEDREPDISTEQIWHRSKDVVFKNKTYRRAKDDKIAKFNDKMKHKKLPKHLRKDLTKRLDGNLNSINVRENNTEVMSCQKYDPTTYTGLYIY